MIWTLNQNFKLFFTVSQLENWKFSIRETIELILETYLWKFNKCAYTDGPEAEQTGQ